MNEFEDVENRNLRKFLKRVGVNSQRIIENYTGPRASITITLNLPDARYEINDIVGDDASSHVFEYGDKDET